MQVRIVILTTLVAVGICAQDATNKGQRPEINVRALPPDPVISDKCTFPISGDLVSLRDGRRTLTETEIGKYVLDKLRNGYTVSLYPQSYGIWAEESCYKPIKALP
jgi:hypothetical protein